jgi:hypothetical protein
VRYDACSQTCIQSLVNWKPKKSNVRPPQSFIWDKTLELTLPCFCNPLCLHNIELGPTLRRPVLP